MSCGEDVTRPSLHNITESLRFVFHPVSLFTIQRFSEDVCAAEAATGKPCEMCDSCAEDTIARNVQSHFAMKPFKAGKKKKNHLTASRCCCLGVCAQQFALESQDVNTGFFFVQFVSSRTSFRTSYREKNRRQ